MALSDKGSSFIKLKFSCNCETVSKPITKGLSKDNANLKVNSFAVVL